MELLKIMKALKTLLSATIVGGLLTASGSALAAEPAAAKAGKEAKPYTLKTCVVSGEKLGEMGKPYVFVHEGQEIKLCCKSCLKDFNKEPGKYLKKLAAAKAEAPKAKEHDHGAPGHQH
jgi:hypothetical protein